MLRGKRASAAASWVRPCRLLQFAGIVLSGAFPHCVLQVAAEVFVEVKIRVIASWAGSDFDFVFPPLKPLLDQFAVMHPQLVEDQEHFPATAFHQPPKAGDDSLRVHRVLVEHEP